MELYQKLLERIEKDEPIYCNIEFAKELAQIAENHFDEEDKECREYNEDKMVYPQ